MGKGGRPRPSLSDGFTELQGVFVLQAAAGEAPPATLCLLSSSSRGLSCLVHFPAPHFAEGTVLCTPEDPPGLFSASPYGHVPCHAWGGWQG